MQANLNEKEHNDSVKSITKKFQRISIRNWQNILKKK